MVHYTIGTAQRRAFSIGIVLFIAALHVFRIESYLQGAWLILYSSYFSDVMIPIAFYFLLCASEERLPLVKRWEVKVAITFLLPAFAETCQWVGIPLLGSTFDLLDYLMYGIGAGAAGILDRQLFSRLLTFWTVKPAQP